MQNKTREYDILIIGGGVTGAALAYGLSSSGQRVALIDALAPAHMASRTNVGMVWCQSKFAHLPEYAKWGFMSARLFPQLLEEVEACSGIKIASSFLGGVIPCVGEEEYTKRGAYLDTLRDALGEYRGEMIERTALERLVPHVPFGPKVVGAAWCEEDGLIDPLAFLRALHLCLKHSGVSTHFHTTANSIEPLAGGGYHVVTTNGAMRCKRLVLAGGLANRHLVHFAMPSLPLFPDKGQVLLVERMPFIMPIPVLGVCQTFGGTTIIGFRHETVGHDGDVIPSSVAIEGRWALDVWPALGQRRIIRTWSGLRVMPDDGMAIYSQLPNHPDAYVIATHSAVTLAAVHARLLPEFILGGALPETAKGMTLARFGYSV